MQYQTSTLHFDLSMFAPDLDFRLLNGVEGGVPLARYADAPAKMDEHRAINPALRLIPESEAHRLTHYLEDVPLPARGVALNQVVFPSLDDHPLPELAMVFFHIGDDDVQAALHRMPSYQQRSELRPHHLGLSTYGVDAEQTYAHYLAVHRGAASIKPPGVTAQALVLQHPEIGSVNGAVTKYVLDQYVSEGLAFSQLVEYLQMNGPGTDSQWYNKSWAMWAQNDDGTGAMVPAKANLDLRFKDDVKPAWPTPAGASAPGLPTYVLTDENDPPAKTASGTGVVGAAAPVVREVLKLTKADETLSGLLWSKQGGTTENLSTNEAPVRVAEPAPAATHAPTAAQASKGFAIRNATSAYGLELFDKELVFDFAKKTLSFPVRNSPSRYLGAYVQFFGADGQPIERKDIKATNPANAGAPFIWEDRLPLEAVRALVEPSTTKNYLTWVSSGASVFGAPVWFLTQKEDLSFLWPDGATHAKVLLGGLGCAGGFADWDSDVDMVGVLGTALVNYGVGALSMLLSVYIINPFIDGLAGDAKFVFYFVCGLIGAHGVIVGGLLYEQSAGKMILAKLSALAASLLFGQIAKRLLDPGMAATWAKLCGLLVGEMTAAQALGQVPVAGWALKIASIAADLAGLAATTIECVLSPATYQLEVDRTMDLTVTIAPDPAHGKRDFKPVWPLVSDHYRIQVRYPAGAGQEGGTTYTKSGPMPGAHDDPITVVFEAIPAGGKIEVAGNVYSETDWLCGRWDSGWINANPNQQSALSTSGTIIEQLVPLTSTTAYSQKQTLAYSAQRQHHWMVTRFSLDEALSVELDKGGAPSTAVAAAFAANGNDVDAAATVTVATPTREWSLHDPAVADTFAIHAHEILSARVFDLVLADVRTDLDNGGSTPAAIVTALRAHRLELPADAIVIIETAGARWSIGQPGRLPRYRITASTDKASVAESQWELIAQSSSHAGPPLPAAYPLPAGPTGSQLGALQNIIHNNSEYALGYAWMAAGQNLPLDDDDAPQNVPMYAMQSLSTLGQPQDQIIEPTRGFSLSTLIAYDQFGLTELFPLEAGFADQLVTGPVAAEVAAEFAGFGRRLPDGAQVAVVRDGTEWQIGVDGAVPLYQLRLVVVDDKTRHIAVFAYPVPSLDNFYLDPRDHSEKNPVYYLRGIDLSGPPGQSTFDYDKSKAWGRFLNDGSIQGLAVHPHGYVVAVDFTHHKLFSLKLPAQAVNSAAAPYALPLSGEGVREGLMQNPQALSISADGRILILEAGNRRIQAFDVKGNPVPSFSAGQLSFAAPRTFVSDLDGHQPTTGLRQLFQRNVKPALAPKFGVTDPGEIIDDLDAGSVAEKLVSEFNHAGYGTQGDTPAHFDVSTTVAGRLWQVRNTTTQAEYDLRLEQDRYEIDNLNVYAAPILAVTTRATGLDWLIEDATNSTRYEVRAPADGGDLKVAQLVSYLPLRAVDANAGQVTYLDLAVEPKGYIYVLMRVETPTGGQFLLDIYSPDGSVLLARPQSGVNAARLSVDQWRSMFTLNFNVVLGPNGRTEPGISQWQPSTPDPATGPAESVPPAR